MYGVFRFGIVTMLICASLLWSGCSAGEDANNSTKKELDVSEDHKAEDRNTIVTIETSEGAIKVELWADKAPGTVTNFLRYVDEKFYDGLIFHRVITGFMIQGGGFTPDMQQRTTHEQIPNEASLTLPNDRGTLAMARTPEIHSATGQFFINLVNNDSLNHRDSTPQGFGYCAFGRVIEGMDVVDRIAKVRTVRKGSYSDVPAETIIIESIRRTE